MNGLVIKNVTKSFGKVKVLENISFSAAEGDFTVLLGPSGCGKSTLLNILAGLEDVSNQEGQIFINQRNVTSLIPKDRDIAMVFQSYALYPNMTISENIAFGLKNRKIKASAIATRVEDVAKILRIENLLDRKPSELSGGQRQRVAMGRAISRSPQLYLFDEPLSNLDAKLRVELRLELKLLHHQEKKSVVYVTHDQIEAMTLADTIIILNKGQIMQIGSPHDIYYAPKNVFVATFIGAPATNIFETTIEKIDNQLCFKLTNSAGDVFTPAIIDQTLQKNLTPYVDKAVLLGIRPEHLVPELVAEKPPAPQDGFTFAVATKAVEFIGSELYVYFDVDNSTTVAKCPSTVTIKQGERLNMTSRYENLLFFDPASGRRI